MSVTAWRITKRKHARNAFSGEGAREFGGRWNNPGTAAVYTAQSQSLAALEMLVHLDSADLLENYVLPAADFDQSLIKVLNPSDLRRNRRSDTPAAQVRSIGDEWVWGAVQRYSGSQAFWFRAKAISCSIRGTRISPGYVLEKRWPFALMRGWGSSCWLLAPGFWHPTSGFWLPGPFLPAR